MAPQYEYKTGRLTYSAGSIKDTKQTKEISVIIPTYNEEKNIERLVSALSDSLKGLDFEIVIVDDNSKDKTPAIIDRLSASGNVAAIHRQGIKGIFSALQDGIKAARGKIVVIMDADFSHPPELVPKLANEAKTHDMAIGSRFLKGSKFEAPVSRKYGPTMLNSICRIITGIKATDIFTGFHAIKKEKFMQIRFKYPSEWGEFDMELLYRAQKMRFDTKEIPFTYHYREAGISKSSGLKIIRFGFRYFLRAIQLRFLG